MTDTCKRGHALTPSNIAWQKPKGQNGYYICKRCNMLSKQKYKLRNKDKIDAYRKQYQARPENREKARQYAAAYREENNG